VTSRETERVLSDALAAYEAHLRDARNRREFGLAASNEVLAVQVERDRAELARLRAGSAAALAGADLARLLDLRPETRVEPVEPLERPAAPDPDVEALVAAALAARDDRAALLARVAAADAQTRVERAARLPQVAAAAGLDYANPNRKILPPEPRWNDTWDVSLSLSLNVFDGGRTSAAVARAQARAEAARQRLEELDRRIRLQVTHAALDLQTAQAAVAVAERALEAARENSRVAADRYREGLIPSAELLDAETGLLRAGLDRTEALAQVRMATAALDRAAGR
jgi:outer membrane protein TolC